MPITAREASGATTRKSRAEKGVAAAVSPRTAFGARNPGGGGSWRGAEADRTAVVRLPAPQGRPGDVRRRRRPAARIGVVVRWGLPPAGARPSRRGGEQLGVVDLPRSRARRRLPRPRACRALRALSTRASRRGPWARCRRCGSGAARAGRRPPIVPVPRRDRRAVQHGRLVHVQCPIDPRGPNLTRRRRSLPRPPADRRSGRTLERCPVCVSPPPRLNLVVGTSTATRRILRGLRLLGRMGRQDPGIPEPLRVGYLPVEICCCALPARGAGRRRWRRRPPAPGGAAAVIGFPEREMARPTNSAAVCATARCSAFIAPPAQLRGAFDEQRLQPCLEGFGPAVHHRWRQARSRVDLRETTAGAHSGGERAPSSSSTSMRRPITRAGSASAS